MMGQKLKRGPMEVLASSMIEGSKKDFAAAIHVLISKPNSVNKTLIGAEIMKMQSLNDSILKLSTEGSSINEWLGCYALERMNKFNLLDINESNGINESEGVELSREQILLPDLFHETECKITRKCFKKQQYAKINSNSGDNSEKEETIIWTQLILNSSHHVILVIFVPFHGIQSVAFVYESNEMSSNLNTKDNSHNFDSQSKPKLSLLINSSSSEANSKSVIWIRDKCFKQVEKWCNAKIGSVNQSEKSTVTTNIASNPSLRLVSLKEYDRLYNELKNKYVTKLLKSNAWSTESTDPEKFIHEDIGIAAYLIMVWRSETSKPLSFADIGCGNGLLVYILVSEGLGRGVGFDLRERKIWKTLRSLGSDQNPIDLRVSTVSPDETNLSQFSEFDWLIGNHSDELTPWLPLMAKKSEAKLFLLPCCPYEFYGKYRRRGTGNSKSIYREYLDYVSDIGERCGFSMEEDRLKIPSTRRICFVARRNKQNSNANGIEKLKNYDGTASNADIDQNIITMLASSKSYCGMTNFSARSNIEEVRNCTKVSKTDVIEPIINTVIKILLSMDDWTIESQPSIIVPSANKKRKNDSMVDTSHVKEWNAGGILNLSELPSKIDSALLAKLKKECGGLQTLFRNHNYIFIVEQGKVRLRCPLYDDHSAGKRKKGRGRGELDKYKKTKICWLFENHPQGCPILSEECIWAHGKQDLRDKI